MDYLPQEVRDVLLSIERIEDTWVVHRVGFEHSYGRVPGETSIKLWSIPRTTGQFLYGLVKLAKPKTILEVGGSAGYSTIWMAAACANLDGTVFTYEIFSEKIPLLQKHIQASGLANIQVIGKDAQTDLISWSRPIDLVFLDADKEIYICYWELIQKHSHSGTILVADNAMDYRYLMEDFLSAVKNDERWESVVLPYDNGLLVAVRK